MARFRAYVTDSEDEEEDVSMEVPPQKPPPVARNHARDEDESMDEDDLQPVTRPQATYEEDSSEEEEEEEEEEEDEEEEEAEEEEDSESESDEDDGRRRVGRRAQLTAAQVARQGDPTIIPRARELGVDPQRMHVMQTSLFRMPEEEQVLKVLNGPQSRRKLLQLKSGLNRKHSRDSEGDGLRADSRQVRLTSLVRVVECSSGTYVACVLRARHRAGALSTVAQVCTRREFRFCVCRARGRVCGCWTGIGSLFSGRMGSWRVAAASRGALWSVQFTVRASIFVKVSSQV